jgi:pyruvate/2-oxoglutarate dehydrogenase complex dihydrolipoamide acyltransferase (E2) component
MATDIIVPKIGFSMTEGVLAEWLVPDGAAVNEGDPLFTLESEKSANEVEAPATGILRAKGVPGETYEVGTVIGVIE